jgi:RNA polymerase sigma factor (sigma-70 family)
MQNPFKDISYDNSVDLRLIEEALNGSTQSLEQLIKRHQHYIYNVASKMVLSPFDAEDITQEVLVKVVTKLSQFEGKSNFRTWLYRITFNHFLKMKKYWLEDKITSFESYGNDLDNIRDVELTEEQKLSQSELIKEAKFSCMMGMLLCLNREQRLVYILGELFDADHNIGAELLDISQVNFRKRLERARKDLYQFMNNKCGLVNSDNPCRCSRKTSGFIKAGWVDKDSMKFNTAYINSIAKTINLKNEKLDDLIETEYANLFLDTPFQEKEHSKSLIKNLFGDDKIKSTFNLN